MLRKIYLTVLSIKRAPVGNVIKLRTFLTKTPAQGLRWFDKRSPQAYSD